MKKRLTLLLVTTFILAGSCASAKPSWEYKKAPDTLFEALNIKDTKRPKKDKAILKTLAFSSAVFIINVLVNR